MKSQFDLWRVPTPELLAVIENQIELPALMKRLAIDKAFAGGFVIKPSQSFGGQGIVVVGKRDEDGFFIIKNQKYDVKAIEVHVRKILQGDFVTSQTMTDGDIAIIEKKITAHPSLARISVGLPDVRVVIFRGIPVMTMARLSTVFSNGKANLKQGAVGAAIRLSDGIITRAQWMGKEILVHPDAQNPIVNFKFSKWQEILATACLAHKSSGLGYSGVDVIIDESGRILVLEVNKRPGLEIQNVNLATLLSRLVYIEKEHLDATEYSPIRAAQVGMTLARDKWEAEEK